MSEQSAKTNEEVILSEGVDEETVERNRRLYIGNSHLLVAGFATLYAAFHMAALNGLSLYEMTGINIPFLPSFPLETWNFRIVHIAGALILGFMLFAAHDFKKDASKETPLLGYIAYGLMIPAIYAIYTALGFANEIAGGVMWNGIDETIKFRETWHFGAPLLIATGGGIILSWFHHGDRAKFSAPDVLLALASIGVAVYLITIYATLMRNSTGTPFAPIGMSLAAIAGTALIMELTRRVAGMALIVIAGIFLVYVFVGEHLPSFLNAPDISWQRFFSQVYTDAGILGPTTAVSSTYIILFIIFAAFLQSSKVGDYFINLAFAAAGKSRGGPAKVAIFASGLMGMINGTSAGNVVATGSLTIPLMKKVGYPKRTAGAIEAAASTGGQIMPPIMGAGAFIMAEITGIPYADIAIAAIIPAVLYFTSIYFMVDLEAAKLGMRGMREDELPKFKELARRVFLFLPIIILIAALFQGYSIIRAGTLATVAAAVISWLAPAEMRLGQLFMRNRKTGLLGSLFFQAVIIGGAAIIGMAAFYVLSLLDQRIITSAGIILVLILGGVAFYRHRNNLTREQTVNDGMSFVSVIKAFQSAGVMSIQIIAVCAAAGIIVGVISLTGVGARFSSLLLGLAEASQLLALVFAMLIAILLGMGMPTTAAYAVAASVVAPGLVQLGIPLLTAHFFVFYFAVVSAITPPVALASYAAAGISGDNPMSTSMASFKIGISAFIVPFMFFYNSAILMDGTWFEVARAAITAIFGVYLLSSGIQGWFMGARTAWFLSLGLIISALFMIEGGWISDLIGVAAAAGVFFVQKIFRPAPDASIKVRGAD